MFEPTQQIIGNYRLLKRLKQDGFVGTYLSEDKQSHRKVVLKTLDKRVDIEIPQASHAFIHAAHIMARLDHLNIISLYDLGEQGYEKEALLYLVTAYATHGSVKQRHPNGSQVPLETIMSYVKPSPAVCKP